VEIGLSLTPEAVETPMACWEITVGGLHGGHSGVDIHRNRANANLVLAHSLMALREVVPLRLQSFAGGSAHNAIPRDARALVLAPQDGIQALQDTLAACEGRWQATFAKTDANLRIGRQAAKPINSGKALNAAETLKTLALILSLPHGVAGLSTVWPGSVESSGNLARVHLDGGRLTLMCSLRSSDMSRLDEITAKVSAVAHLADAQVRFDKRYPAWEVDLDSDLLARCRKLYRELFSEAAKVEVMHAGLECGVIGAKVEGMEMISIGPTLEYPHSPQERLHLPAVEKVWVFLKALLKDYAA
jgi:dipeptidase D